MRYDWLPYMPAVNRLLVDKGQVFTQARLNVPLCQPARVSFLTGQTSKYNGDLGIGYGGTKLTGDHDNCIGKWMADAGYRAGFIGKYVNATDNIGGIDPPAGYLFWRELLGESNGYKFKVRTNDNSMVVKGIYPTDYLVRETNEFLAGGPPFFCVVTPTQPHEPYVARKDLADKFEDLDWPVVNEVDVSDKPPWTRNLKAFTPQDIEKIQVNVRGALRELLAVDDMVDKIISALPAATLANTIIIFTSDNGVYFGEHRRPGGKSGPHEVALRVPLIVAGPGFEHGPPIDVPSLVMQDITATALSLGGARAGRPHQGGIPLNDIVANPGAYKDRQLLHEIGDGFYNQTGDGITTGPQSSDGFRKLYRYPSVRSKLPGPSIYEAYDLDTDENELQNWADDPARRAERDRLEADLDALLT